MSGIIGTPAVLQFIATSLLSLIRR
jgi:hypothetical protein